MMKPICSLTGLLLWVLVSPAGAEVPRDQPSPFVVLAEAKGDRSDAASQRRHVETASAQKQAVVYRPPKRGSARARVGGGTRGVEVFPVVEVMAPDHVGLTTRAQPVLAWFSSRAISDRVDFTLLAEDAIDPLVEATLPGPMNAGVQLVSLADLSIELEPGKIYEWSISVVVDAEERDKDMFASGKIELQAASAALQSELASGVHYRAFARHGVWYDAVADLSAAIVKDDSPALGRERAELLAQVDLKAASQFETERIGAR